ncbi:MAG: TNT domain-containing protein, partial [Eubacterium sp.]|nr:TNT domain-containing protein [Eubacterium sp.]
PISALKKNVADVASIAKKTVSVASKGANYVAVANSPTATNAAKAKAKATYLQSKAGLAVALAMKKACSVADRINIKGINNQSVLDNFRDDFKAETGLDAYAIGNAALALVGVFSSASAMGLGILAAPETGGASLALTAFAFGSLAFACSDFIEYVNEIDVSESYGYKYGTDNRANNWLYDDVFKENDTVYNNVRMFADLGTIIFSLGTSYAVAMANKSPANVIKNVAGQKKYVHPTESTSWYNEDGSINYPPNGGAVPGTEKTISLKPGDTFGRYGNIGDESKFVTQVGTNPDKLSLPPFTDPSIYQEFVVVKPIPQTLQSEILAWGPSNGGGIQYELPMSIKELIRQGYIIPR